MQRIEPILKNNLLTLGRALAQATGVSLSTVSRYATNDANTLKRLSRKGGSITLRKYDDAIAWFTTKAKWPDGMEIPAIADPAHNPPN